MLLHAAIRGDGKVVAIDSRSWLLHRRELGAAYRTELARELAQLGFQIERGTGRGGRYFELEGVPRELIERWSSRHWQVQEAIRARLEERRDRLEELLAAGGGEVREAVERLEALAAANPLTPKEDRLLTTSTRTAKVALRTHRDLDGEWATTAKRLGFDPRQAERIRVSQSRPEAVSERELRARLTEFQATFTEREARAVALEASAGLPIPECLQQLQRMRPSGDLLALAGGLMTTRHHRALERHTVELARQLAGETTPEIAPETVQAETTALERRLATAGGSLAYEQRHAIELASSQKSLVMIEGHAGTGKSTALQAIARAHQRAGQRIIVTSTAALAAERLANELRAAGVEADAYSTVALEAALAAERIALDSRMTVIHEEAALASTREHQRLLFRIERSRARAILLGDPRQSQAVGAGGLWPELKQAARANQAHAELTRNVRALDEQDRGAQRLFREGEHERALESYAQRGRVSIAQQQRHAEDQALEAAQADREAGRHALVIAQTSNEHLDELNARAQAIRSEHAELGNDAIPVAGRPYLLHVGDEVQVRHSIPHPALGRLRNGTTGQVTEVDAGQERLTLRLADGRTVALERAQLEAAEIRLAYVQHPFPAQGQTTDSAHLIVSQNTTAEGSYVAITRARRETHIYSSREQLELKDARAQIEALADYMGRSEPEVPSIRYPLAHEARIRAEHDHERTDDRGRARDVTGERGRDGYGEAEASGHPPGEPPRLVSAALDDPAPDDRNTREAWQKAASAIGRYRARYTPADWDQVPVDPHTPPAFFEQRYRQREAAAEVLDALSELEPELESHRELRQRGLRMLGLDHRRYEPDRPPGWEF